MAILRLVSSFNLPQGYIAAGLVRNLVWDTLHHHTNSTPLNDIDVIYFDSENRDTARDLAIEAQLSEQMPELNWQVRNQARMHERNGDKPYLDVVDAMSYWPEKETAVAAKINPNGMVECISAFGYESLFALHITHNPKRDISSFDQRVTSKNWLTLWPKLTAVRNSV
ncbi:nucleotidyltransferase family protein [Vibrio sinaloensis]|uniref:nucleotidyltransferase family protein n=1 Tax=Photobacterium sp. (strain ATCC 43367) TaxID=379097 RepID=UPI0006933F8E|nr:nucleotidyltransferase family protein [Vibrio sinaloensis]